MTPIQTNKHVFFDDEGNVLEGGSIWVGQPSVDPRTNPKTVTFTDAGGSTFTAAQPMKTKAGRIVYNGKPIQATVDGEYSMLVFDSSGKQTDYSRSINASGAGGGASATFDELLRVGLTLPEIKAFDVAVGDHVRSVGEVTATDGLGADWLTVSATGSPADDVDLIDFDNGLQGRRVDNVLYRSQLDNLQWFGTPVGGYLVLQTDISGVQEPPTDRNEFRYIKLTAGESGSGGYNEGALTGESTSGSPPLVLASAQISTGPLSGSAVRLLNTENRYLMPGEVPGALNNDHIQNITGSVGSPNPSSSGPFNRDGTGAFETTEDRINAYNSGADASTAGRLSIDASNVARTSDHTNVKRLQATYYMRIK